MRWAAGSSTARPGMAQHGWARRLQLSLSLPWAGLKPVAAAGLPPSTCGQVRNTLRDRRVTRSGPAVGSLSRVPQSHAQEIPRGQEGASTSQACWGPTGTSRAAGGRHHAQAARRPLGLGAFLCPDPPAPCAPTRGQPQGPESPSPDCTPSTASRIPAPAAPIPTELGSRPGTPTPRYLPWRCPSGVSGAGGRAVCAAPSQH